MTQLLLKCLIISIGSDFISLASPELLSSVFNARTSFVNRRGSFLYCLGHFFLSMIVIMLLVLKMQVCKIELLLCRCASLPLHNYRNSGEGYFENSLSSDMLCSILVKLSSLQSHWNEPAGFVLLSYTWIKLLVSSIIDVISRYFVINLMSSS